MWHDSWQFFGILCSLHNNNRDILTFVKKKKTRSHNTNCTFYYFRSVFDVLKAYETKVYVLKV